jgi:polyferredoxin
MGAQLAQILIWAQRLYIMGVQPAPAQMKYNFTLTIHIWPPGFWIGAPLFNMLEAQLF